MIRRGTIVRVGENFHLPDPLEKFDADTKQWWLDAKEVLMRESETRRQDILAILAERGLVGTPGSLLVGAEGGGFTGLPPGKDGQFLSMVGSRPAWVDMDVVPVSEGGTGVTEVPEDAILLGSSAATLRTLPPVIVAGVPYVLTSTLEEGVHWAEGLRVDPFFEGGVTLSATNKRLQSLEPPGRRDQMFLGYVGGVLGWNPVDTESAGIFQLHALEFTDNGDGTWSALVSHDGNTMAVVTRIYRTGPAFAYPHREIECEVLPLDADTLRISTSRDLTGISYVTVEFRAGQFLTA